MLLLWSKQDKKRLKTHEDSAVDTRGGAKQPITLRDPARQQDLPVQCLLMPAGVLLQTWATR